MKRIYGETFGRQTNKGSVLLFILGVLALLSMLGMTLVFISRQEQEVSKEFILKTRAQFAAESGVETAIAKLLDYKDSLVLLNEASKAYPDKPAYSVEALLQSSFGAEDVDGDGLKEFGGVISETHFKRGDRFKLKVESTQGKLNLNDSNSPLNIDSDPYEDQMTPERKYENLPPNLKHPLGKDPDWLHEGDAGFEPAKTTANLPYPKAPGRLRVIIRELIGVLFPNDPDQPEGPDNPPADLGEEVAGALMDARTLRAQGRFSGLHEIRQILVPKYLSEDKFKVFSSFVTLESWQDRNVLRPTFQWRMNTPPRRDPDDPASAHLKYMPGDLPLCLYGASTGAMPKPIAGPIGLEDTVIHDFNYNGSWAADPSLQYWSNQNWWRGRGAFVGNIQTPNPDKPYDYCEHLRHDRDIYLFSDMQTRYFATEARSPIDVNQAPVELLEALIRPLRGWYLKEAPDIWDGESPRSRAEDWSQPWRNDIQFAMMWEHSPGFPWLQVYRMSQFVNTMFFGDSYCSDYLFSPDYVQYYYYDAYARNYAASNPAYDISQDQNPYSNPQTSEVTEYAMKSGRYGELQQTKGFDRISKVKGRSIAELLAKALHDRVHPDPDKDGLPNAYNPFYTWEEFEYFIRDLADADKGGHLTGDLADFDGYAADCVIANFNPNARLNDYNPNKRLFLHVDKSQLIGYSAEFCFHPMGQFNILCYGETLDATGRTASSVNIDSAVATHEIFRVSTQQQFMKGLDPVSGLALGDFFSAATGVSPQAGANWDDKGNALDGGFALQSYPEPVVKGFNYIKDCEADGYLMLSVSKPGISELLAGSGGADEMENTLLANYDGQMDALYARGSKTFVSDGKAETWTNNPFFLNVMDLERSASENWSLGLEPDPQANMVNNNPGTKALCKTLNLLRHGGESADAPGNLHPDGALSDAGRSIVFESLENFGDSDRGGKTGCIGFWIKPNFDVAHSNRIRKFFCNRMAYIPRSVYDQCYADGTHYPFLQSALNGPDWNSDYIFHDPTVHDFSLYYFSRGGRRVAGSDPSNPDSPLDDELNFGYSPDWGDNDGRWLPTRAMFLNAGRYMNDYTGAFSARIWGMGTSSVNQSWRQDSDGKNPTVDSFNLEGRQWSHVAFSWDYLGEYMGPGQGYCGTDYKPRPRYFYMAVNGKAVPDLKESKPPYDEQAGPQNPGDTLWQNYWNYFASPTFPFNADLVKDKNGATNYIRFGESSSSIWGNESADSTYDNIVINKNWKDDSVISTEFNYGRYDTESDAAYTSPKFDLFRELGAECRLLELHSICWTAYMPLPADNLAAPGHGRFNDNLYFNDSNSHADVKALKKTDAAYPPDPMAVNWGGNWVPFSFDIESPLTGKWFYEDAGIAKGQMPNFAGGSRDANWNSQPLRWEKGKGIFRFQIHFNLEPGQALMTSPALDDCTFVFSRNQGRVLRWEANIDG